MAGAWRLILPPFFIPPDDGRFESAAQVLKGRVIRRRGVRIGLKTEVQQLFRQCQVAICNCARHTTMGVARHLFKDGPALAFVRVFSADEPLKRVETMLAHGDQFARGLFAYAAVATAVFVDKFRDFLGGVAEYTPIEFFEDDIGALGDFRIIALGSLAQSGLGDFAGLPKKLGCLFADREALIAQLADGSLD